MTKESQCVYYVAIFLVIMPTSLVDIRLKELNIYLRNFENTKKYRLLFKN